MGSEGCLHYSVNASQTDVKTTLQGAEMGAEVFKRKLTAVMSADVKGYSLLMGKDEMATVKTITAYRDVMTGMIEKHMGRVVDTPGDNILAEFASAVDAVECAVAVQNELKEKNTDLAKERRMVFRIGINVGDVIQEGERIYGDGVNIAARIEGLADPGGVSVSRSVFDQVKKKLSFGFADIGEHAVKNIEEPVRVYRVLTQPDQAHMMVPFKDSQPKRWPLTGAVVAILISSIVSWFVYQHQTKPEFELASVEKMSYSLPEKPSIVVLPFDNMSDDPEQEYFSDGLTEEIITAFSKVPGIFVIARNSTFTYKGKPVKVQQVAEDLGVRYVLEGSVRKAKDRVRITAQLIDATTGYHLWGERYERELKDIFAVQDDITIKILMALQVNFSGENQANYLVKGTENLDAYLKLLKGREYSERMNKEANTLARQMYEDAISLDPAYAMAYLRLSATYIMDIQFGSGNSPEKSLQKAFDSVQKALEIDDELAEAHAFLGRIYLAKKQYDEAIAKGRKALVLAPNSDFVQAALAFSLHHAGRAEEAIPFLEKAIRLNPIPPDWYLLTLAASYQATERHEEAIALYQSVLRGSFDNLFAHLGLACTYSMIGRDQDARIEATEVLKINPEFSIQSYKSRALYKKQADMNPRIEALQKAGLPE